MAKHKRKIVKPIYVTKADRVKAKKKNKQPMPKELRYGLIFCGAALALAVILFLVFYRGSDLPVRNGVVQREENWIVTNLADRGKRYYKLGEVEALEGFEARDETSKSDKNETDFWYDPLDPDNQVKSYYITGVKNSPDKMIETVIPFFLGMYGEENISEAHVADVAGRESHYFFAEFESEAESGAQRTQILNMYIPAARNASVLVSVSVNVTEEKPPLSDDALLALAEEIAGTIAFESENAKG